MVLHYIYPRTSESRPWPLNCSQRIKCSPYYSWEQTHVSKVGTWNNAKCLFNNAVCEAAWCFVHNGQLQPWFSTGQEFLENATKIHKAAMLLQQLKSLWRRENVQMEKMRQQQLHRDSGLWKIPEIEKYLYRTEGICVDNAFKKTYQKKPFVLGPKCFPEPLPLQAPHPLHFELAFS